MLMRAIRYEGCADIVRDSALEADSRWRGRGRGVGVKLPRRGIGGGGGVVVV